MRPLLLNPNSFFCGTDIEHPVASRIYKTEVDILRSIANEGPCVIVGRCADYVLEGHPGLVSLFVSAPMEARVARVMRRNNLSECDARSRIARVDKNRASYYRYFTDENWGQARNYDLCINSGKASAPERVPNRCIRRAQRRSGVEHKLQRRKRPRHRGRFFTLLARARPGCGPILRAIRRDALPSSPR